MPPRPASAPSARLRSATTRAASSSDSTPATHGGGDLALRVAHHRVRLAPRRTATARPATPSPPTAPAAPRRPGPAGAPGAPAARRPATSPRTGPAPRSHSASRAANTGEDAASSRPMPAHCEPWPGKTNTTRPAPPRRPGHHARPRARPAASAASPAQQLVPVRADDHRPVLERRPGGRQRQPTSAGRASGPRGHGRAASRAACARSAVRGPRRHQPRQRPAAGTGCRGRGSGRRRRSGSPSPGPLRGSRGRWCR